MYVSSADYTVQTLASVQVYKFGQKISKLKKMWGQRARQSPHGPVILYLCMEHGLCKVGRKKNIF